jgi:hypothetical protein
MKRAIILITVLTIGCLAAALTVDHLQQHTAQAYMAELPVLREAVLKRDFEEAKQQHGKMEAAWEQEALWLDCLISHDHTREVFAQVGALKTAIDMEWQEEALKALDALDAALEHIETGEFYRWDNFL